MKITTSKIVSRSVLMLVIRCLSHFCTGTGGFYGLFTLNRSVEFVVTSPRQQQDSTSPTDPNHVLCQVMRIDRFQHEV